MTKDRNNHHESAAYHVTGTAVYIDDIPVSSDALTGKVFFSQVPHAEIRSFDLREAKKVKGVFAVLSAKDIPGINNMGPVVHDEPVLAEVSVQCIGQAMFLIAADSEASAEEASGKIKVKFREKKAILTLEEAMKQGKPMYPARFIISGDVESALKRADHVIGGEFHTGGQEHWYLETHAALCVPGEGDEMRVYASSQHPSETQTLVAEVLSVPKNVVEVEVKRMGGGFGGKETQGNHIAIWAALLAKTTRQPVKIRLCRDDDQKYTGKRHPFLIRYQAGFSKEGILNALDVDLNSNAGYATDLSRAILERAMFHAENAYFIPNIRIKGTVWKTNQPSNTAFRGFGGPQGIAAIENIIDRIARRLGLCSAEIRRRNFYGARSRNKTPYGQIVKHNHLPLIYDKLLVSSQYLKRKNEIDAFNKKNEFFKKGIALSPVKFGISFTTSFLNQAGALVHLYTDGTILVNHGGTEMGQGLHTKIRRIAAKEFGAAIDKVVVNATNTSRIPNTSATAASSGTDMNGMAVKDAIRQIKAGILPIVADHFNLKFGKPKTRLTDLVFSEDHVIDDRHKERKITLREAANLAYLQRVSLSAVGFYKTPGVFFDWNTGKGHPFYYFAFGMAVTEVLVDTLTGAVKILRADILHDVGDSIEPLIDRGQIEGGYIQGVGWCTTEELRWDEKGNLLTHSPDTYKIPTAADIPDVFNVELLKDHPNPGTIHHSKAVGEPPFMLGISCWLAIKYAISASANHRKEPELNIPATNEAILFALEKLKSK